MAVIPSQHPVDAIVRAIVAGADHAARTFADLAEEDQTSVAVEMIDECITLTKRLDAEGLLEGWENRNSKSTAISTTITGTIRFVPRVSIQEDQKPAGEDPKPTEDDRVQLRRIARGDRHGVMSANVDRWIQCGWLTVDGSTWTVTEKGTELILGSSQPAE